MALIDFKGIKQNSSLEKKLTDEEFESIAKEYYAKPDYALVEKQFKSLHSGGVRMNVIYDYYIKEVMSKAVGTRASWSIYDGIHNRQIMEYFAAKVDKNKKVFPDKMSLAQKIESAFRLCGIRYCVKLPNFPLKTVKSVLQKYDVNGNYYDFSCGWASRLLGSLTENVNYFGTDPNDELVVQLKKISDEYRRVNGVNTATDIRCIGSQEFVPEWENKMGLAFSSPPYFSLEDYQIGDAQSYKPGMTYPEWRDSYIKPTVENITRYLVSGGRFIVNVKSFRDYSTDEVYPIERDFIEAALRNGLKYVCTEPLAQTSKRCHGDVSGKKVSFNDNEEKMFVFQKPY